MSVRLGRTTVIDLLTAIDDFLEAERGARKDTALRKLERDGTVVFQRYFRSQGTAFARRLARFQHFFPSDDGAKAIKEALSPSDWDKEWEAAAAQGRKAVLRFLTVAYRKAVLAGGQSAVIDLSLNLRLSGANPEIVAFLRNRAALRVAGIDESTRRILATLLTRSAQEGWGYKRTAREIIARFEQFAVGSPLGHIASRAELIAVQELGEAYIHGSMTVGRDLVRAGVGLEKAWLTAQDERVCAICEANEAAGYIPFDDSFPFGSEPPGHVGCKCDILLQVASDIEDLAA